MTFKQASRLPDDPGVSVNRVMKDGVQDLDHVCISCGDQSLTVSEFNAARLFGMIALMLGIPLSAEAKKIKI